MKGARSQWMVSLSCLTGKLAETLELSGSPSELFPQRVWRLGRLVWQGTIRDVMFVRGLAWADASALIPSLHRARRAIVFVSQPIPDEAVYGFRLKSGSICTPGGFLNHVCFEVGIRELIRDGYLCPLVTKAGIHKPNTDQLHVRTGEFIASDAEALMDQDNLVETACGEIVEHARNRNAVLIFASGTKHGLHIVRVLEEKHSIECGFVTGDTLAYTTGADNRLTSDGTWTYGYDDEGNLTTKTSLSTSEVWSYGYDHRNQLVKVERETNGTDVDLRVEYQYDAWGNRIEKSVDGDGDGAGAAVLTRFAQDGWNPAKTTPIGTENFDVWADLDGSNDLVTRYLRGDAVDELFARIDAAGANPGAYWYLTDHLGSVRDVLDNAGVIKDSLTYDGFGNITAETDAAYRGRYAWTGREVEAEVNLQYNRARYYDAATGRWISQDPLGFDAGDSNLYRYATNQPLQTSDPSGMAPESRTFRGKQELPTIPLGKFGTLSGELTYNGKISYDKQKQLGLWTYADGKYEIDVKISYGHKWGLGFNITKVAQKILKNTEVTFCLEAGVTLTASAQATIKGDFALTQQGFSASATVLKAHLNITGFAGAKVQFTYKNVGLKAGAGLIGTIDTGLIPEKGADSYRIIINAKDQMSLFLPRYKLQDITSRLYAFYELNNQKEHILLAQADYALN